MPEKKKTFLGSIIGAAGKAAMSGLSQSNGQVKKTPVLNSGHQDPRPVQKKSIESGPRRIVHEHKHVVIDTQQVIAGINSGKYQFCKELAFRMLASELINLRNDFDSGIGEYNEDDKAIVVEVINEILSRVGRNYEELDKAAAAAGVKLEGVRK